MKLAPRLGEHAKLEEWSAARERDPRRGDRAWLERVAPGLRAGLRLRRARCRPAADADLRVPARDRPPHEIHDRGDFPRSHRGRPGAPLSQRGGPQRRRAHRRRGHLRDLFLLARVLPGHGRGGGAGRAAVRRRSWATPTTLGCWPRRSTPRTASCSETSRRRSATSGSSWRRTRSTRHVRRLHERALRRDGDRRRAGRAALRGETGGGRPAGRGGRARARGRRVRLLGLHPLQDAAAAGRGAAGGPRGARRARGRERPARSAGRLRVARLHGVRLRRHGQGRLARRQRHRRASWPRTAGGPRAGVGGRRRVRRRARGDRHRLRPRGPAHPRPGGRQRRVDEPRGDRADGGSRTAADPGRGSRGGGDGPGGVPPRRLGGARRGPGPSPAARARAARQGPGRGALRRGDRALLRPARVRRAKGERRLRARVSRARRVARRPAAGGHRKAAAGRRTSVSTAWASSRDARASRWTPACAPPTGSGRSAT